MKNKLNSKKLVTFALTGVAVGVAVWFLLKTDKGKDIGNDLMASLKDKMNGTFDEFSGHAGKLINELKSKANNVQMPV